MREREWYRREGERESERVIKKRGRESGCLRVITERLLILSFILNAY